MPTVYSKLSIMADGMNSTTRPSLLKPTEYALGVNVACRGGLVHTRPGFVPDGAQLPTGSFLGARKWSLDNSDYIVMVISGRVVVVRTNDSAVLDLGVLLSGSLQCFIEQADRYIVIQNGVDTPVVLQYEGGVISRYPAESTQLVPGTVMIYAHSRLHYSPTLIPGTAKTGRPYFISSDVCLPDEPENIFKYTEGTYLNGGGAHGLPTEMGFIFGMGVLRNASTGTGMGEVVVFARNGVCSFDLSLPRSYWDAQPLSQVMFFDNGTMSPLSITSVNNDVVYRALDGLRTISFTERRVGSASSSASLSNTSMSFLVDKYFATEPQEYLPFVSSAFHNNRLYTTVGGINGSYFLGLFSFDAAVTASNTTSSYVAEFVPPAYDGIWTGLAFARVLTALRRGKPTCYIVAAGPVLYRIDESAVTDYRMDGTRSDIESMVVTSVAYGAAENGASMHGIRKHLQYVDLELSDIRRDTTVSVYFRPAYYAFWSLLGTRTVSVPANADLWGSFRSRVRFGLNPDNMVKDPDSSIPLFSATGFQFAIAWKGSLCIDSITAAMNALAETTPEPCDTVPTGELTPGTDAGIVLGEYGYLIEGSL